MTIILSYGCHSTEEPEGAIITICNDDLYEYKVILYSYPEEHVVQTTYLSDRYNEYGQCDEISNLYEGRYYMSIIDIDSMCEFDRTDVFYANNYDSFYFYIDEFGSLIKD